MCDNKIEYAYTDDGTLIRRMFADFLAQYQQPSL